MSEVKRKRSNSYPAPRLGELVAYHDPEDDLVKTARVVFVWSTFVVNLAVFQPLLTDGQKDQPIMPVTSVQRWDPGEPEELSPGSWTWGLPQTT